MSKLRPTKEGLLIPSSLLKGLTGLVSVQRQGNVLLIESERRRMARRRAARMVQRLRRLLSSDSEGHYDTSSQTTEVS